jgi:NAD(P)-dependent dehydrogenase (short-subunit alcohol dehydrogenase family)
VGTTLKDLVSLKNRTALVTGGAGYLGTAMCEVLAELGANVVIVGYEFDKSYNAANRLQQRSEMPAYYGVRMESARTRFGNQ